jgi:hypothetical protein
MAPKPAPKHKAPEKDPNFMVQVNEPRMLRKDLLESIREIIIFMQGYEKFRKIQEDKVALFTQLRTDLRILNSLIDDKLYKYLPKGKLKSISPSKEQEKPYEREEQPLAVSRPTVISSTPAPGDAPRSELDELENQLKDIESQLRSMG